MFINVQIWESSGATDPPEEPACGPRSQAALLPSFPASSLYQAPPASVFPVLLRPSTLIHELTPPTQPPGRPSGPTPRAATQRAGERRGVSPWRAARVPEARTAARVSRRPRRTPALPPEPRASRPCTSGFTPPRPGRCGQRGRPGSPCAARAGSELSLIHI